MAELMNKVPVRPASRNVVYSIIDGERDYQDAGEGNAAPHPDAQRRNGALSPGECLLCIEQIAAEARAAWYKPDGQAAMAPFMRKIAGVSVQFMENYTAPPRACHDPLSPDTSL